MVFSGTYEGMKVLVTGHTGFKGCWLTTWLIKMGAKVVGLSSEILTEPAMFNELGLEQKVQHYLVDVRDLQEVKRIINTEKPDFVFHLAAQAIVSVSYSDPVGTFTTNTLGTMNILESLRSVDWPCVAIFITSDKCYDNVEWVWGYKESDSIGGKDIYSGSKGAAELLIKSYYNSFFSAVDCPIRLGVGRAGNVIGGGDWSKDRIVVDCMRAWSQKKSVEIRSPSSTRPWQHVLEPISGYLTLGSQLYMHNKVHGEAFNFGPRAEQNRTVLELLNDLSLSWGFHDKEVAYRVTDDIPFHEAGLLKLNCDKALFHLRWEPNLTYKEMIEIVSGWYRNYYKNSCDMFSLTVSQIENYEDAAKRRQRIWTQ